jgi:glyoxylase-like metal-dependent hydrolase (beta-lactamase superfamily II)/rhodanese-related sulfurtransferase
MKLKQLYLGCLSQASYLIVDERTKTAAVVDPRRDVDEYLREAELEGAQIRHVLLTHFHADFLAGHLELRERTGARIHLGRKAVADFPFEPLGEGDRIEFGDVRLVALETPGHTPEAISILVYDLALDASEPRAVLTGDTLFIGDVGRPDLLVSAGVSAEDLAGMLYDSLHEKLLKLPDETLVYPAHGAGSMCGRNLSPDTVSTIGVQRRTNYALAPMSKADFVRLVAGQQPDVPAYFAYDAGLNRALRPTLGQSLAQALRPLSLEEVLRLQREGHVVLDTRDAGRFAAGHLPGAVNVGLDGKYATWCGTVLSSEDALVLVAEPGRERESALRLGRIGFDRVSGYLDGGMQAAHGLEQRSGRVETSELRALLAAQAPPLVLDVRTPAEWEAHHIDGALHVPLNRLSSELARVPRGRPIVVTCKAGYRSSIAKSLLAKAGYGDVRDLVGGMDAWQRAAAAEPR